MLAQALPAFQLPFEELLYYLIHLSRYSHYGLNPLLSEEALGTRPHTPGDHAVDPSFSQKAGEKARLMPGVIDELPGKHLVSLNLYQGILGAPAKVGTDIVPIG